MLYKEYQGFVYLINFGDGIYKIGRTKSLGNRIKDLTQFNNGELIHSIETNMHIRLEKFFHHKFSNKRIKDNGELFYLADEDVKYIRSVGRVTYLKDDNKTAFTNIKNLILHVVDALETRDLTNKEIEYIRFYSFLFDNNEFNISPLSLEYYKTLVNDVLLGEVKEIHKTRVRYLYG